LTTSATSASLQPDRRDTVGAALDREGVADDRQGPLAGRRDERERCDAELPGAGNREVHVLGDELWSCSENALVSTAAMSSSVRVRKSSVTIARLSTPPV
jgi:hypothetical protein